MIAKERKTALIGLAIGSTPAIITFSVLWYYGMVYLAGSFTPAPLANGYDQIPDFVQRVIAIKPLFVWLFLFAGLASFLIPLTSKLAKLGCLIVGRAWPEFQIAFVAWNTKRDERERLEGPEDVRIARRKLQRWPKGLLVDWFFSFYWVLGQSKEKWVAHNQKIVSDWEAKRSGT